MMSNDETNKARAEAFIRKAEESPAYLAECQRWCVLNELGEALGFEEGSVELSLFVGAGINANEGSKLATLQVLADVSGKVITAKAADLLKEHGFLAEH